MPEERGEVTVLLDALRKGHREAEPRLFEVVYADLERLARGYLRKERPDHTLHATDLVHEAYLRIAGAEAACQNRAQFFGLAAQAMRRILVDHARAHRAGKRGEGRRKIPLDEALFKPAAGNENLIEVDEVLQRLALNDPALARLVELRYFVGLSVKEIAAIFKVSERTVKRAWQLAKCWLRQELSAQDRK
jgi:RNA polymerase sigma factor (TIGR02999 family)